MDPLSIGSAIVGLIAAATRIGPILHHFITHTRDAPKSASQILNEMQSISAALEQLQAYIINASESKSSRRAMISLRSIVTSITACVTTYSDLERVVEQCVLEGEVRRVNRRASSEIPYLRYTKGEIFDVYSKKKNSAVWLARNQTDWGDGWGWVYAADFLDNVKDVVKDNAVL